MPPKKINCPHPGCTNQTTTRNKACWEHTDWRGRKPNNYNVTRLCIECGKPFKIHHSVQLTCRECMTLTCVVCGKQFKDPRHKRRATCSPECSQIHNSAPMLSCQWCGQSFKQRRGHSTKYCGNECRYLAARKPHDDDKKRTSWKYRSWRKAVLQRDNHACVRCGTTKKLAAHHIEGWSKNLLLRYAVDNGITLCEDCHSLEHNGRKMNHRGKEPKLCSNCGAIKKTHVGEYCKSCAMKLSPKARAAQERMLRASSGRYTR